MRKHRLNRLLVSMALVAVFSGAAPAGRILIFSKTADFRHGSIEAGIEAIRRLGDENGFEVD